MSWQAHAQFFKNPNYGLIARLLRCFLKPRSDIFGMNSRRMKLDKRIVLNPPQSNMSLKKTLII